MVIWRFFPSFWLVNLNLFLFIFHSLYFLFRFLSFLPLPRPLLCLVLYLCSWFFSRCFCVILIFKYKKFALELWVIGRSKLHFKSLSDIWRCYLASQVCHFVITKSYLWLKCWHPPGSYRLSFSAEGGDTHIQPTCSFSISTSDIATAL
jgi:hypothetical protein